MSDEKKLSFEDAKSVIESCYGFDDATTPAGEAWAIVNDKIADLEQRLAAAETVLTQIRTYLSKGATIRATDPSVPTLCIDGNNCSGNLTVDFDAEKEKQQAIDAALEHVAGLFDRVGKRDEAAFLRSWRGTNPLAEARAQMNKITGLYQRLEAFAEKRIAELEAEKPDYRADELANAVIKQNDLFAEAQAKLEFANQHNRRMAQIQELDAASIVELQTTLAEAQARIDAAHKAKTSAEEAELCCAQELDEAQARIAELTRQLAEANKHRNIRYNKP